MREDEQKFRELIVPHFDAAYNLALWLTGNGADAADVLQDASVRAFRFVSTLKTGNSRSWFFQIVRNSSYTLIKARRQFEELDQEIAVEALDPEESAVESASVQIVHKTLSELPTQYREILVLRELQEASYEEIAEILEIPLGTVMSRLARARGLFKKKLKGVRS